MRPSPSASDAWSCAAASARCCALAWEIVEVRLTSMVPSSVTVTASMASEVPSGMTVVVESCSHSGGPARISLVASVRQVWRGNHRMSGTHQARSGVGK